MACQITHKSAENELKNQEICIANLQTFHIDLYYYLYYYFRLRGLTRLFNFTHTHTNIGYHNELHSCLIPCIMPR